MSLNIAPPLPHNIVNAAAPTTESLAHANAIKEVVPAPVQAEAIVPQKSREQDVRPPVVDNPTYDGIKQLGGSVIPDDPLAEGESNSQQGGQESSQEGSAGETGDTVGDESAEQNTSEQTDGEQEKKTEERAEQAKNEAVRQEVQQLERRDDEVRAHEQAHASVGGGHAGTPSYQYETGPNGQKYAVSGEVPIDVSKEPTAQETIQKMQTVRAAALAPAEPSSQDRKVAAEASQKISEARAELIRETSQAASSSTSDDEKVEVNTESPIGEEPRKRALADEYNAVKNDKSSEMEAQQSQTLKLAEEPTSSRFELSPVGQVIQNRYSQSYQTEATSFNAVA
ncbi:putative metalloprotease CJM1_0395 family protein [Psychrosphaera algicola]|uniref:Metalloprotease CJM1_0395 family protein n=1 Tax=Psychrosphaera algicola TaxID=3023714 RepID=A0ABT5FFE6_9GAMM|nr:putative metalloprotease CJM1_0395 family protein [Psychrosphaera sp. G1-22]MDC2889764.1 putative metalloprotease CJM1_0395 family protein [Psychrosphaera sp. G1-22]